MGKIAESTSLEWDRAWDAYTEDEYEYHLAQEENSVRWQYITGVVLKKYGSFENIRSIEVGAGSGHLSMLFARRGAHVTMFDYSQKALDFCQKVFRAHGVASSRCDFMLADALNMDPKFNGGFDVSMSFGVTEHVSGHFRSIMFKTHIDLLRPGGTTIISVPYAWCIPFKLYNLLVKRNMIECYPYTKREFRELAHEAGVTDFQFFGSSFFETYNIFSFIRRKKGRMGAISDIKKEKPHFLDSIQGRALVFVGYKPGVWCPSPL